MGWGGGGRGYVFDTLENTVFFNYYFGLLGGIYGHLNKNEYWKNIMRVIDLVEKLVERGARLSTTQSTRWKIFIGNGKNQLVTGVFRIEKTKLNDNLSHHNK